MRVAGKNVGADPFRCEGCHDGDFADFDHYCDVLEVPMDMTPHAFAAWMAGRFDWKGNYGPHRRN